MLLNLRRILLPGLASGLALLVMACANPALSTAPVTVSVTGSSAVALGSTAQYAAKVAGSTNQAVTWTVNQASGGNAQVGTISTVGLYSAPAAMPSSGTVIIAAVSAADSSITGIISVALQAASAAVTVTGPSTDTIGTQSQYSATVAGAQSQSVNWSINGVAGGNATIGTIAASGVYTAPASVPANNAIVITATSMANPGLSGNLNATILAQAATSPATATPTAAARFLDQTSFGPTAASIAHVQQIGLQAALTEQFNQPATPFSEPSTSDPECGEDWQCTRSDFFKITAFGNDQLRQRVAMALSELWVAPVLQDNALPFYLNTLGNDAFSNYRQTMQDATLSPAMGTYLNMLNSGKPGPGQIANENFAREIMQLFSLGLDLLNADGTLQTNSNGNAIPAYTQLQVQAFARAYTGWTNANADGSTPSSFNNTPNWNYLMVPVEGQHDTTQKIVLNGTTLPAGQSAEQDLKGALDNIFAHPNVGPFISKQLIQHLVTGNPSPGYVQRVSAVFADNGSGVRGDMKAVVTAIIMDQEARAGDAQTGDEADSSPAVDGGHLREPLLWAVNLERAVGATQTNPSDPYPFVSFMYYVVGGVGEAPFSQSSVFNYFSPQYVVPGTTINSPEFEIENTGTIIPLQTVADIITRNGDKGITVDLSATSAIGQKAADPAQLADYLGMLFMHSQMPTDMRTGLITAISAIPVTDLQSRAQVAVYLVVTSSQYKIIH